MPLQVVTIPRSSKKPSRKILVVEDERAIRELLQLHLQNAGHECIAVADAVLAGRTLLEGKGSIDLLIVDAQLPYMSGIEFVSTIIADTTLPSVPVILITGHEHLANRAGLLGVPCLVKPFSADHLIGLIDKTLESASPPASAAGLSDSGMMRSLAIEYRKRSA
jgi:two-component system phosphate regulon response regulator PhoB